MYKSLSDFYNSSQWRAFRMQLISDRSNKADGVLYSEISGLPLVRQFDIVLHHKTPLTMSNVNDFSVSLNPANIIICSHKEHDELHHRFGYATQKKIYIVYGAPCAGKTTFVRNNKGNSDLVIDIDSIWEALSGRRYDKPDAIKTNVFAVRDLLLEQAKTRAGKWERCWIIGGYAARDNRNRFANSIGAELIFIDTDETTCLKRLHEAKDRVGSIEKWSKYISDYFKQLQQD